MPEAGKDLILQEDLEYIAADRERFSGLSGSTVLVTGATGLIGSLMVRTLLCCDRLHGMDIRVIALVRNPDKARAMFGPLTESGLLRLVQADVTDLPMSALEEWTTIDYILHGASVTASKTMISRPVETISASVDGTKNILEAARSKGCRGMVYLSSMEVYGTVSGEASACTTERDIGYLDPLRIRSNYPESKRLCENMCAAYAAEYGVPVRIARLAQTFGAGVLPGENRVFAQFARSAMEKRDIVLHTQGLSEGNYCYTRDAIAALLTLLTQGEPGQAYNVSNPDSHTTIRAMAEMVCERLADGEIRVVYDIPEENVFGYAADTKMKLDIRRMQALGWQPRVGLPEAYERMIASMRLTGV